MRACQTPSGARPNRRLSGPLLRPRVWSHEPASNRRPRGMIAARKGTEPGLQTHSGFFSERDSAAHPPSAALGLSLQRTRFHVDSSLRQMTQQIGCQAATRSRYVHRRYADLSPATADLRDFALAPHAPLPAASISRPPTSHTGNSRQRAEIERRRLDLRRDREFTPPANRARTPRLARSRRGRSRYLEVIDHGELASAPSFASDARNSEISARWLSGRSVRNPRPRSRCARRGSD